jgi:Protein of unknown function (DUF3795)
MEDTRTSTAFENVRDQVGFCGLWCGSCVVGNGALAELTRRYERLLTAYGIEEWVPPEFAFREFKKGLESIAAMPVCRGCRRGGGWESCPMRTCAIAKGVYECAACPDAATCTHQETLQKMRAGAATAGLRQKAEPGDAGASIERWTSEIMDRWPCCVLAR